MMTLFNAREREQDDWNQLLRDADRRFKLVGAKKPEVGTMGLIQVVWDANVVSDIEDFKHLSDSYGRRPPTQTNPFGGA